MSGERQVEVGGKVIVLSDKAAVIANTPAPMAVVEDIYSICERRAWVIVATAANSERKVAGELTEKLAIAALAPTRLERKNEMVQKPVYKGGVVIRWKAKTISRKVERVLFPGYILAQLPCEARGVFPPRAQLALLHADGVRAVLSGIRGPIPLSDAEVHRITHAAATGDYDKLNQSDWIKIGAIARITDGPFASFKAPIEELVEPDRVRVSADIFGRATPVWLTIDQIERPC